MVTDATIDNILLALTRARTSHNLNGTSLGSYDDRVMDAVIGYVRQLAEADGYEVESARLIKAAQRNHTESLLCFMSGDEERAASLLSLECAQIALAKTLEKEGR